METIERWKKVKGFEERYLISDHGNVIGLYKDKRRFLKPAVTWQGRTRVHLHFNGKIKYIGVHQLVALHFVKGHKVGLEVNHVDGNKNNNHYTNLEWVTNKENHDHATRLKLMPRGEKHGRSKIKKTDIPKIISLREDGLTHKAIGEKFGVTKNAIRFILIGETWNHLK